MAITPTTRPTTQPATASARAVRVVLILLGGVSAFVAINVAFGGLETLGLQGPSDYFNVTDHDAYLVRDSHARFYGGVYLGIAAFLIVASTNLAKYRSAVNVVFALIFLGGVARLSQLDLAVTFGPTLVLSSLIELVGMPALALWLTAATTTTRTADQSRRSAIASNA